MVNKEKTKIKTGYIIKVLQENDKSYTGYVVRTYPEKGFLVRVLSGDSPRTTYESYGMYENARFQILNEVKSIKILAKPQVVKISDKSQINENILPESVSGSRWYLTTNPEDGKTITFCKYPQYGGGWSFDKDISKSLTESLSGIGYAYSQLFENVNISK